MRRNNKKILKFPKGFLWGTSTSAYQVEGGIVNDWSVWENSEERINELLSKNKKPQDYICGAACNSWNLYKEDIALAKNLNTNAIRFGIEWSRICPEKNRFNAEAIEHYKNVINEAKKKNLKIALTLWHWTNPLWFSKMDGWEKKENIKYFLNFVEFAVSKLGPVDFWVTLNEPMVHIANGYINAKFPPNKKCIFSANRVFNNLVKTHIKATKIIHKHFPRAKVGITNLTNYFEPANWLNPIEFIFGKLANYFWNFRFLDKIQKHMDFIGTDYYFHDRIIWHPPFVKNLNEKTTDMGWEIYPKGIYYTLKLLAKYKKPIFVMENGLADAKDKNREEFIRDHLIYVYKAIKEGVDVRGYFYWSLLDNFEWAEGFAPKFGLYEVNRQTFERQARASAQYYAEICKNNALKI